MTVSSHSSWKTEMPTGWQAKKLKYLASLQFSNVDKNTEAEEIPIRLCNYTDVYYNKKITHDLDFMPATATPDEIAKFALRAGDVLVTKDSEMWNDIAVPAYVPADLEGVICGYHLAQVRPKPAALNGKFLTYSFMASGIREQFHVAANGITRYGLSQHDLSSAVFPEPPLSQQDAIVAFLEATEREIQSFITNKQRIIELLKEQRTALISRVVMRGINPNAPRKPSGIPFVGDIPNHWQIIRNKHLFREINNRSETGLETKLSMSQKHGLIPTSEMQERSTQSATFEGCKICDIGDLVLNKLKAHIGVFAVAKQRGLVSPDYTVLRPRVRLNVNYYDHLFHTGAFVASFKTSSTGMVEGFLRLYADAFGRLPSVFPPPEEQDAIVRFIAGQSENVATAIATAEQEIELMKEYRTALIAATVTGKMDVRQTSVEVVSFPRPNRHFARALLSAEIVHQLHTEPTFGRIKHQKILHLCEYIGGIEEIQGEYHREAAGPLDNKLIYSVEAELKKQKWFAEYAREKFGHGYRPLEKAGGHRAYVEKYWQDKLPVIQRIIDLMRSWDTERCEIFSTAYAAWNDLLIWRKTVTDDAIVHEILHRWHDRKKQVPESRWRKALEWMRKEGFVPTGSGKPTAKCATEAGQTS